MEKSKKRLVQPVLAEPFTVFHHITFMPICMKHGRTTGPCNLSSYRLTTSYPALTRYQLLLFSDMKVLMGFLFLLSFFMYVPLLFPS